MKKIIKDTFALFLITVIAGLLLGIVYQVTAGPIAEQNRKATLKAYKNIFSSMEKYEDIELTDQLNSKFGDAINKDRENCGNSVINAAVKVFDASGNELGTIFTVTNKEGYGGDIRFTVGVKADGTIAGLEVLEISETAGLGAKAKDASFREQFKGKNYVVKYSKTGATGNEIDAITSATYTTKAMVHGVNSCLAAFAVLGGAI